jgi:hypothetical protein
MGWFWSLFAGLLGLLVPVLIIGGIVYLVARSRRDRQNGITAYSALMAYFYFVTAASVITMAAGAICFVYVAVDQAFRSGEIASDITVASVLVGMGLIVCLLHVYGRRAVERMTGKSAPTLRRVYLFCMLGIFGLAGLIALPLAVYQLIDYYVVGHGYLSYVDPPSESLAVAIVVVPLWAYYLFRVFREIRQPHVDGTEI